MTDSALFCPKCQSPAVTYSTLAGGTASCDRCGWAGTREDLLAYIFESGFKDQPEILRAFSHDVRMLFVQSNFGVMLTQFLLKWGFVTEATKETVTPYFQGIGRAVTRVLLEVRQQQEAKKGT